MIDESEAARKLSDYVMARAKASEAVASLLARPAAEQDAGWLDLLRSAGTSAWNAQDVHTANTAWQQVFDRRSRTLPDEHPDLQKARGNLALSLHALGDLAGARALQEKVLAVYAHTLPDEHPDLQKARGNLAVTIGDLGDLAGARGLQEKVVEVRSRTLPDDHLDLQTARVNLARSLYALGDLAGARALLEKVVDAYARALPEDHPDLQTARSNLAATLKVLGDLAAAHELQEKVLEVRTRTLPEDHADLQMARANVAMTLYALGDLVAAHELQVNVLEVCSRTLPADHPDLQRARESLGVTMRALGRLHIARELEEQVLEVRSRTLPEDHPDLQRGRLNLAGTLYAFGDLAAARELQEKVLEVYSRTLPADHPDLQLARNNLAGTLRSMGDTAAARELQEAVLEAFARTLPEDHPDLQMARANLALTMDSLGELAAARELEEKVLEVRSRTLPEDHPDLQTARLNCALRTYALGDLAAARELFQKVLEVRVRTLPEDHPDLQTARHELLCTSIGLDLDREATDVAHELCVGLETSITAALGKLSPHELEERVEAGRAHLALVLSVASGAGQLKAKPELDRDAFALIESSRSISLLGAAIEARTRDEKDLVRLGDEEMRQTSKLARLAQSGASRDDFTEVRREVDRLRREALAHLTADPSTKPLLERPTAESLAATLGGGEAIVSYWRYTRSEADAAERWKTTSSECLLAYVLRQDGQLVRVELGPIAEIDSATDAWRESLLVKDDAHTVDRGRPAGVSVSARSNDTHAGESLRALIFDPLRNAIGEARHLIVVLDDVLLAVPLDVLPLEAGLIGDRYRIELQLTLRELLWPRREVSSDGGLVALGDASFDSQPEGWTAPSSLSQAIHADAPPQHGATKSGDSVGQEKHSRILSIDGPTGTVRDMIGAHGFERLAYTGDEAREVAAAYSESREHLVQAIVLEKKQASRIALEALATQSRYLHLATHGWFAPESFPSLADPSPLDSKLGLGVAMTRDEQVRGTSPMLLCGLALAGANLAEDELGRVPGMITAEELASFDLSNCELAVLSACDTNVGVRRAGQGVAGLQRALHMAGARSVITSLWKVPDEATKELMVDFYRRLWVEKKPKHQALWEAKARLRDARDERGEPRYSTRDWAAWVLTGDPD